MILFLLLILGAGLLLWWIAIAAYRGRYLRWVFSAPVGTPFGSHWALAPMAIAGTGVLFVDAYTVYVVALPNPEARPAGVDPAFTGLLVIFFVATIVLSYWMPRSMKPAWYREWEDHGRPEAEIREVIEARRQSRKQDRSRKGR